jgi:hypothetical protein
MSEKVLKLIVESKIVNKKEIARLAGIQLETLDDIIDLLCQRGYLRVNETSCTEHTSCSGCSMADTCTSSDKLGRALYVTEKGRQYVKSRRDKNE